MRRNTVQIPVANGEPLASVRFRSRIFVNVTVKFQDNFEKPKMINIYIKLICTIICRYAQIVRDSTLTKYESEDSKYTIRANK